MCDIEHTQQAYRRYYWLDVSGMQPSSGGFLMSGCKRCSILEDTIDMLLDVNKALRALVGESNGESE